VIHQLYTNVRTKCIGDSVIPYPVYGPAVLVIHWLYTNVGAKCIGDYIIPCPMYNPVRTTQQMQVVLVLRAFVLRGRTIVAFTPREGKEE
jgi:hypothetical protein